MKNKTTSIIVGVLSTVCLVGAIAGFTYLAIGPSDNTPSYEHTLPDVEDHTTPFQKVEQKEGTYSKFNYLGLNEAAFNAVTPANGDVNILVVPVQFKDRDNFTDSDFNLIDSAFNGIYAGDHSNSYRESCKSFYEKSSNAHLNFNFDITDAFIPSMSSEEFVQISEKELGLESQMIISDIYNKGVNIGGQSVNLNSSKYDSNRDGFFDGIWLIYNDKNPREVFEQQKFWAYTTNFLNFDSIDKTKYKIAPGRYANCSILFLGYERNFNSTTRDKADAHTLIHETGHMLGLDDYYDAGSRGAPFGFAGGLDMMDLNIGDHNAFSKYALGWTKAKIVDETSTVELKPFASSYDSIILPSGTYNGSAFSEYIMIEYYTPENLFKKDSREKLNGTYPLFYTKPGLRIWHIDARLGIKRYTANPFTETFEGYLPPDIKEIPEYSENSTHTIGTETIVAHNNYVNSFLDQKKPHLITLVSSTNTELYDTRPATNRDLYSIVDSNKDAFSGDVQNGYFHQKNTESGMMAMFNDGSPMNYSIRINSMDNEKVELSITKK